MFTRVWHWPIGGAYHQNSTIHLCCTCKLESTILLPGFASPPKPYVTLSRHTATQLARARARAATRGACLVRHVANPVLLRTRQIYLHNRDLPRFPAPVSARRALPRPPLGRGKRAASGGPLRGPPKGPLPCPNCGPRQHLPGITPFFAAAVGRCAPFQGCRRFGMGFSLLGPSLPRPA
jgi:hypothetical protein